MSRPLSLSLKRGAKVNLLYLAGGWGGGGLDDPKSEVISGGSGWCQTIRRPQAVLLESGKEREEEPLFLGLIQSSSLPFTSFPHRYLTSFTPARLTRVDRLGPYEGSEEVLDKE